MTITDYINQFAEENSAFSRSDILSAAKLKGISAHSLDCALSRMVQSHRLKRDEKGIYSPAEESAFPIVLTDMETRIAAWMNEQFPRMTYSLYNGQTFAPLQHHLSYNTITYVEVDKWNTQTVFDRMRDAGFGVPVYLCPDSDFIYNYVNFGQSGIIVKKLITEAPLQKRGVLKVPTLEKLLIDIRVDADLSYLSGFEAARMLENARSLYSIKESRLRRYAKRRNVML